MTYEQLLAQLATIKKDPNMTPQQAVAKHLLKMATGGVVDPNDPKTNDDDTEPAPVDQDALVKGTQAITGASDTTPVPPAPVTVNVNNAPPTDLQAVPLNQPPQMPPTLPPIQRGASPDLQAIPLNQPISTAPVNQSATVTGQGPALQNVPPPAPGTIAGGISSTNGTPLNPATGYPVGTLPLNQLDSLVPLSNKIAPTKNIRQVSTAPAPNNVLNNINSATKQAEFSNERLAAAKQPITDTQLETQTAENNKWVADRSLRQAQIQAALDRENAEIKMSDGTIDPYRFWKSKTTPEKILAGLSMFIGGFQRGGIPGALNPQPMFDAVNNDIQQQIAGFERHGKVAGLYGQMVRTLQDQGVDANNAHTIGLANVKEQAATQIDQMINKYAPVQLQAQLKQEIAKNGLSVPQAQAEIMKARASASADFANANKTNFEVEQAKRVQDILAGIGGKTQQGGITPVQESILNKSGLGVIRDPATGETHIATKDGADSANKALPKYDDAINKIEDFIKERNTGGVAAPAGPHRRALEQKHTAALLALDGLNGVEGASTRLSEQTIDLLKDNLGPENEYSVTPLVQAKGTLDQLQNERAQMKARFIGGSTGIKSTPY